MPHELKWKVYITFGMNRYPEHCSECPAFTRDYYACHNERGMKAGCQLGYMDGFDTRDFYGQTRHPNCHIETDGSVSLFQQN